MNEKIMGVLLKTVLDLGMDLISKVLNHRRKMRDDFVAAVCFVKRELVERGDNVDKAFVDWHSHSVRILSGCAGYFINHESRWWHKVEPTWEKYKLACQKKDPAAVLIIDKINRQELLQRLDNLLYAIR